MQQNPMSYNQKGFGSHQQVFSSGG